MKKFANCFLLLCASSFASFAYCETVDPGQIHPPLYPASAQFVMPFDGVISLAAVGGQYGVVISDIPNPYNQPYSLGIPLSEPAPVIADAARFPSGMTLLLVDTNEKPNGKAKNYRLMMFNDKGYLKTDVTKLSNVDIGTQIAPDGRFVLFPKEPSPETQYVYFSGGDGSIETYTDKRLVAANNAKIEAVKIEAAKVAAIAEADRRAAQANNARIAAAESNRRLVELKNVKMKKSERVKLARRSHHRKKLFNDIPMEASEPYAKNSTDTPPASKVGTPALASVSFDKETNKNHVDNQPVKINIR